MLACKLLIDPPAMTPNSTGFGNLKTGGAIGRRLSTSQSKRRRSKAALAEDEERSRPVVGSLMRTRILVLAALRVWELKQRIRK